MTHSQERQEIALTDCVAPSIPLTTRLVTDALLVGRQVLGALTLPLLEQRTDTALDQDLELPLEAWEREVLNRQLARIGEDFDEREPLEVPRVNIDEVTPGQVRELLRASPLVFEGLARTLGVLDKWGFDDLASQHKNASLWITNTDFTEFKGTLGDLLDEMMTGEHTGRYVRGAADIFLQHPELEQTLPLELMAKYIGELGSHFSTEMFIGGPGTGSQFHCAPFFNFFTLIHGEKQWQFVHPSYTRWMYAFLHHNGFGISRIDHRLDDEVLHERWPLYRRVPRLRARLEAGDMLINPPWWWHSVDNLSPSSIGVATRWAEPRLTRTNPRFELASLISSTSREVHRAARRAGQGSRLTDAMWRERFNLKPSARLASWLGRG